MTKKMMGMLSETMVGHDPTATLYNPNPEEASAFPLYAATVTRGITDTPRLHEGLIHWHHDLQFMTVIDGHITIETPAGKLACPAGSTVFLNVDAPHRIAGRECGTYAYVLIPMRMLGFFPGSAMEAECVKPYTAPGADPAVLLDGSETWHEEVARLVLTARDGIASVRTVRSSDTSGDAYDVTMAATSPHAVRPGDTSGDSSDSSSSCRGGLGGDLGSSDDGTSSANYGLSSSDHDCFDGGPASPNDGNGSSSYHAALSVLQLWAAFTDHVRFAHLGGGPDRTSSRIRAFVSYIQERYGEQITIDDIAAAGNVSRVECGRCFRAAFSTSPYRYLTEYRLERAGDLLRGSDTSVTDIALACGFGSASHFSNVFRAQTGVSPRAYRKQVAYHNQAALHSQARGD